jgi:transposase
MTTLCARRMRERTTAALALRASCLGCRAHGSLRGENSLARIWHGYLVFAALRLLATAGQTRCSGILAGHPGVLLLAAGRFFASAQAAPAVCGTAPPRQPDRVSVKHPGMSGDSVSWESGAMGRVSANYPRELRERAIAMVREVRPDYPSEYAAIEAVAKKLGIGTAETLRKWIRQAEVDAGARAGVTSDESAEMRKLRAGNRELRRANEILKAASAFFAAELDRPLR